MIDIKAESPYCSKCKTMGQVIRPLGKNPELLIMECMDCKHKWVSYSKICPVCKEYNKYVIEGMCVSCYEIGKQYDEK